MQRYLSKRWLGGALLLLAVGGVFGVYRRAQHAMDISDPDRARRQGRPIPVRTAQVTESEIEQVIGATAITTASNEAAIRAISPSRGLNTTDIIIKAVHVQEGDPVRPGQLLFEVEDEVRNQGIRQAKAALAAATAQMERVKQGAAFNEHIRQLELASAEANLKFRMEDLENRQKGLEIFGQLHKDKAASSLEYYESRSKFAQARFELSESERRLQRAKDALTSGLLQDRENLAKAEQDLVAARIDLEEAQRDVARCQVRSPIEGFIDNKVEVLAGQVLAVTSSLARVVRLNPIHVRLDFPQDRLEYVSVGQQVEMVLDSFPQETFLGTVIRVGPVVNPQLRVFPVVVEMNNPGNRIKAGISGFARLRAKRKATIVPAAAVVPHGSKAIVFRVVDNRAQLREIQTKHLAELGAMEVKDGLAPGDEVVVYFSNFYRHWRELTKRESYLHDNDFVDTDWRKWARRD